jgi:hypothetical protein
MLVSAVALVALISGLMLAYHPSFPLKRRSYEVGVATASILVDTPKSQVVEVDPTGSDALGGRANVLANLMVDGDIKTAIARRAHLAPKQLVATSQSPGITSPAAKLKPDSRSYATSVAMASDGVVLPIIKVQTQAPNVTQAIQLANAAVDGLGDYLDSRAVGEAVSNTRRLRVRPLGTAQGQVAMRGPSPVMALGVVFVVFVLGCAMILMASAVIRGWRQAESEERGGPESARRGQEPARRGQESALAALPSDEAPRPRGRGRKQPAEPPDRTGPTKLRAG